LPLPVSIDMIDMIDSCKLKENAKQQRAKRTIF